jgi:hypothetical protein
MKGGDMDEYEELDPNRGILAALMLSLMLAGICVAAYELVGALL